MFSAQQVIHQAQTNSSVDTSSEFSHTHMEIHIIFKCVAPTLARFTTNEHTLTHIHTTNFFCACYWEKKRAMFVVHENWFLLYSKQIVFLVFNFIFSQIGVILTAYRHSHIHFEMCAPETKQNKTKNTESKHLKGKKLKNKWKK